MPDLVYENELFQKGFNAIAGIDEAGRGSLAGPVVAACVVVGPDFTAREGLLLINDSKKLSAKKREDLFSLIKDEFGDVAVGIADNEEIDRLNILQATFLAMRRALSGLRAEPDFVLVDGNIEIPAIALRQRAIIKGDSLVFSIAVASIIAKVARDRLMEEYDKDFPGYGFIKHKGYGTKEHLARLRELGPARIHRRSFEPIKSMVF